MMKLLVVGLVLGLSTYSWAYVVSASSNFSDTSPNIVSPGDVFTLLFRVEDISGAATSGIEGCETRVLYDSTEVEILSITDNIADPQSAAPYPPGFKGWVLGYTHGAEDDGAGTVSPVGGTALTILGGTPIAQTGSPAVIVALEVKILGLGGDNQTTITLERKAASPGDTFGLSDGRGGDAGLNLPYSVTFEVPEPTTTLVIGSGLVGLLGIRSRRRISWVDAGF